MVLVASLSRWLITGTVHVVSRKLQLEQHILHCQLSSAGVGSSAGWDWYAILPLYLSLTVSVTFTRSMFVWVGIGRSLYCERKRVWDSAAYSAVIGTLGGPLFHSVKAPPPPGWNTEHRISCQPASPELPGRSLGDREDCEKSALVSQLSSSSPQLWLTQNGCALS